MNNLLSGLRKFSERVFPQQRQLFEELSQGQVPHTLMITCSDSRIDPNLFTQTKPGEIFMVRNAGNIIPPFGASTGGEEAAIEFAIEALGVSNIVICGHSQCGAMAALLNNAKLTGMPCVHKWLVHAQATKKRLELTGDINHLRAAEENVLVQADNLKTHPSVSAALRSGKVQLYGWVYLFESGTVTVYDPHKRKYLPSIEVREDAEKNVTRFAL